MKTLRKKKPCSRCGARNTLRDNEGADQCLDCLPAQADCESASPDTGVHPCLSPQMGDMLVNEVVPRLKRAAHSIPKVGHEDDEEIVQDATLMAARMMASADLAGRSFTGGNMAWYAAKAARSGRRSHYTGASDVMSPRCQFEGKADHLWLDMEIELEFGDVGTLHDVIAPCGYHGQEPDPAEEAARNLDWEAFLTISPKRFRVAIEVLLSGGTMREAGQRCGLRDSGALNLKRRIAASLVEFFGEDVIRRLLDGVRPDWESDLRAVRENCHRNEGTFQPLAQQIG